MTLTLKNNDALALIPGRKTRNRFVAMLLLSMGLLLSGLQPAFAAPGHSTISGSPTTYSAGCYDFTISYIKNSQPADGATNDIMLVTVTDPTILPPASNLVDNVDVTFTINNNSGNQTLKTGTNGWAPGTVQFSLNSSYVIPINVRVKVAGACNVNGISGTFNYIPLPPNPNPPPGATNPAYYIVTKSPAIDNGQDPATVEVHVTDGFNNVEQQWRQPLSDLASRCLRNHRPEYHEHGSRHGGRFVRGLGCDQ